jgi:hypothetical protein
VAFETQPTKLSRVLLLQSPESPRRHQAAPSLPANNVSLSIEPESSMAMMRLGCTAVARNSGPSGSASGAAGVLLENATRAATERL